MRRLAAGTAEKAVGENLQTAGNCKQRDGRSLVAYATPLTFFIASYAPVFFQGK